MLSKIREMLQKEQVFYTRNPIAGEPRVEHKVQLDFAAYDNETIGKVGMFLAEQGLTNFAYRVDEVVGKTAEGKDIKKSNPSLMTSAMIVNAALKIPMEKVSHKLTPAEKAENKIYRLIGNRIKENLTCGKLQNAISKIGLDATLEKLWSKYGEGQELNPVKLNALYVKMTTVKKNDDFEDL